MIPAHELQPGAIYRPTRPTKGGPNAYYIVLTDVQRTRLLRRLGEKQLLRIDPRDARCYYAMKLHDAVVCDVYHRYTNSNGERIEYKHRATFGSDDALSLREVKAKPGYIT